MGYHSSCVNMEMCTGIYTNAQNVSHLGDVAEDLVAKRKKELRWIQVQNGNKDSLGSERMCVNYHEFEYACINLVRCCSTDQWSPQGCRGSQLLFSEGFLGPLWTPRWPECSYPLWNVIHLSTEKQESSWHIVDLWLKLCSINRSFTADKSVWIKHLSVLNTLL